MGARPGGAAGAGGRGVSFITGAAPGIAVPDAEDRDVERTEWTPSAEQLGRYQAREVELARANLALLKAQPARFSTTDTLHSRATLWRAVQGV